MNSIRFCHTKFNPGIELQFWGFLRVSCLFNANEWMPLFECYATRSSAYRRKFTWFFTNTQNETLKETIWGFLISDKNSLWLTQNCLFGRPNFRTRSIFPSIPYSLRSLSHTEPYSFSMPKNNGTICLFLCPGCMSIVN